MEFIDLLVKSVGVRLVVYGIPVIISLVLYFLIKNKIKKKNWLILIPLLTFIISYLIILLYILAKI
ncbi:hypothetical protein CL616_04335 [archaeon]|nr:hypothetical protein [archaeon]